MNYFPIIIVAVVFIVTAIRTHLPFKLEIWLIMCIGALLVLFTGSISPYDALKSINTEVMIFLFLMFVLGEVLEQSGFLYVFEYKLFSKAKNTDSLLLTVIFSMGMLSYIFMNDTVAVIATPLMLFLSKKHGINQKILLLALAFSITLGSAASPIGNPQNLLIAVKSGLKEPFTVFAKYLLIPSAVNLLSVFIILKIFFFKDLRVSRSIKHEERKIEDYSLYRNAKASVILLITVLLLWIVSRFIFNEIEIPLYAIPVLPALYGLATSGKKKSILKKVDYKTLLFFIGMFILMKALYLKHEPRILFDAVRQAANVPQTLALSIIISQIVSNVPFAALFIDTIKSCGKTEIMMALAAGSTIAGNLFILGAASNVIIIQKAERERITLSFMEFFKCGFFLTAVNFLVYWAYFALI
ncbi:MAG: SLC13 family permease [bacterium]